MIHFKLTQMIFEYTYVAHLQSIGKNHYLVTFWLLAEVCTEGKQPCDTQEQCYTSSERCDNITHCDDGTDERNCGQ